uniref:G-protein coupled receptors family 1 profile domain-containing protein n=1 Tax=Panagrolaimus sp. ES5 TaxID=591445 RepID=A0AC34GRF5_9BILA
MSDFPHSIALGPTTATPELVHLYPLSIAISTFILSVFGAISNVIVIIAIMVSPELRNRCYFLICYLAISDLICCIYYSLLRVLIFTYRYNLTNYDCFMWSFIGLFAMNTQTGLTVMLGVDRFLAVSQPYKYRKWHSTYYIIAMIIPPNIYAFIITGYGYIEANDQIKVPVCFPPSAYSSNSRNLWVGSNGVIIFIVLLLYFSAQHIFRKSQQTTASSSVNKMTARVLKSLMVVMIVYAGTWAFTMIMMMVISFIVFGTPAQKVVEIFLVWPVVINASSNFIIYFWRTEEFRRATLRLFGCEKKVSNSTSVIMDKRTSTQMGSTVAVDVRRGSRW